MRLVPQQYMLGEKEKLKVMQSMENKLMKAIKEVNESELPSTESSPLNSPRLANQAEVLTLSPASGTKINVSSITIAKQKSPSQLHTVTR